MLNTITTIYHEHDGIDGYRSMRVFLARQNMILSILTVHKYMNGELHIYSIVRKKQYHYEKGVVHKVFPNLINQELSAEKINQWGTNFTFLFLTDGSKRIILKERGIYENQ